MSVPFPAHEHCMYHTMRLVLEDACYWANQRARGPCLCDIPSDRRFSMFGDALEYELTVTMRSAIFATNPYMRCFISNHKRPDDPDFICPFRREMDFELKTSSESDPAIRCGGRSHTRKKPCWYIIVKYDRDTFRPLSARLGWVRPEDWSRSCAWLKADCMRRFVEIYDPGHTSSKSSTRPRHGKKPGVPSKGGGPRRGARFACVAGRMRRLAVAEGAEDHGPHHVAAREADGADEREGRATLL